MELLVAPFFEDGIGDVAQALGNGAVGFDVDGELGHAAALPYLLCGYLDDVVLEDVEACGLGVEDHNFLRVVCVQEFLQVSVVSGSQDVGGAEGPHAELVDPAAR